MDTNKKTIKRQSKKLSLSSNSLYDTDFYKWANTQVKLLEKNEFDKIDLKNVIEEIRDLGISQRSALKSQMIRLLMHMLKVKYQPEKHSKSWDRSIGNSKIEMERIVEENPSLKGEMLNVLEEAYRLARKKAALETGLELKIFPEKCPWTLKQAMKE